MQPISGLHIASLIDPRRFETRLHHEDWHGPFDTSNCGQPDLVFLTGLQPDFDRMRQLAFFFRRSGALVVGGGSVCTSFPEFATRFFDVVCVGGVESAAAVAADFLRGELKSIYRSPTNSIRPYTVDYAHFARSGINPSMHLVESSRGCSFKCSFCSIPAEVGAHAPYGLTALSASIDSALASAPFFSFRRWYPIVLLLDNNFSDNRDHMLAVCELMRSNRKIRGWGALVTQNLIHDRDAVRKLSRSKCNGLFVGIESLDRDLLRRQNKTQNLGRRSVLGDIAFAESQGIGITYGYLFDPRHQTAAEMLRQIEAIARHPLMPMPTYISVIAPLAGTKTFWDGETIAYSRLADKTPAIVDFLERMFRRPWLVVDRRGILIKTIRRIVRSRTLNPIRWYFIAAANFHCFLWSSATTYVPRTYLAGSDTLDPQYWERPPDLSDEDRARYFDPVALTDSSGAPSEWLKPYLASRARRPTTEIRVDR
jgi:hopanoid C-2 methylase